MALPGEGSSVACCLLNTVVGGWGAVPAIQEAPGLWRTGYRDFVEGKLWGHLGVKWWAAVPRQDPGQERRKPRTGREGCSLTT